LHGVQVCTCASGAEAQQRLGVEPFDFITVALRLPDMDGLELAHFVRASTSQAYMPVIVVSGDVDDRLRRRTLGDEVTDYFDKGQGYPALAEFVRGYLAPRATATGEVLYVEDSRVVALATRRILERSGMSVRHVTNGEDALAVLETAKAQGRIGPDLVLTDVSLKGLMTGGDLLERIRGALGYSKGRLPVLVMTGDANRDNQAALLTGGANDLVEKPVEERLLMTKLLFQVRVAQRLRANVQTRAA
jgi:CheY-like chemotaxis protein